MTKLPFKMTTVTSRLRPRDMRYCAEVLGQVAFGPTAKKAQDLLAETIRLQVTTAPLSVILVGVDGTTLVGQKTGITSGYTITGPARENSWVALNQDRNLVAAMEQHAESCYGGVQWVKVL